MLDLVEQLSAGAGFAVVTEEAISGSDLNALSGWLDAQPEWSDFPFVLLTQRGGGLERNPEAGRFLELLGNVTFLERPFHPTTFVSLAQSAIRGRRRQYDARARLEELNQLAPISSAGSKSGRQSMRRRSPSCTRPRSWRHLASLPVAWRTTSTTC